jgi:hypothetical protein
MLVILDTLVSSAEKEARLGARAFRDGAGFGAKARPFPGGLIGISAFAKALFMPARPAAGAAFPLRLGRLAN